MTSLLEPTMTITISTPVTMEFQPTASLLYVLFKLTFSFLHDKLCLNPQQPARQETGLNPTHDACTHLALNETILPSFNSKP